MMFTLTRLRQIFMNGTAWTGSKPARAALDFAFKPNRFKRIPREDLTPCQRDVFEALDSAIRDSGYTFEKWTGQEIADDLNRYAPDIDQYELDEVIAAVDLYFEDSNEVMGMNTLPEDAKE